MTDTALPVDSDTLPPEAENEAAAGNTPPKKPRRRWLRRLKTVVAIDHLGYSREHGCYIYPNVAVQDGRSYTINPADIPKGRGDGVPLASLIDMPANAQIVSMLTGEPEDHYLLANSGGYGFICKLEHLYSRLKAGKTVMTLDNGETVLPPVRVHLSSLINPDCKIVLATAHNRLLAFPLGEMKIMAKGRGLQMISLQEGDRVQRLNVLSSADYRLTIVGKRGGISHETLHIADITQKRGRKGKILDIAGSLHAIEAGRFAVRLAAPPGWAANAASPDWRALAGRPWICPQPGTCCGQVLDEWFDSQGFRPARMVSIDQESVTATLIAGGVGIGLLHAETAQRAQARGEAELLGGPVREVALLFACLRERLQEPLISAAISAAREAAAHEGGA